MGAELSWWEIIKIGLGGGLVVAVFNHGVTWWKEKGNNKRMRIYSAIRMAVELEGFAVQCLNVCKEIEDYIILGTRGKLHGEIPKLGVYPDDIEWRLIESSLCARILQFKNEIELSQIRIKDPFMEAEEDSGQGLTVVSAETAKCGMRAWSLAKEVRKKHDLPEFKDEDFTGRAMDELQVIFERAREHYKPRD